MKFMRFGVVLALILSVFACKPPQKMTTTSGKSQRVILPNGWSLTPAGRSLPLGDFPINIAVSARRRLAAVMNNGVGTQSIQLFDFQQEKQVAELPIAKGWYGLAFNSDGTRLYASGGNDNTVVIFSGKPIMPKQPENAENNAVVAVAVEPDFKKLNLPLVWSRDTVITLGKAWPNKIWPAGLAPDEATERLFVAAREDSSLYVCNTKNFTVEKKIKLEAEAYSCAVLQSAHEVWVTVWGGKKVVVFDKNTLVKKSEIAVGEHPNELIFNRKGNICFVANASDNSVSVVATRTRKVLEVLDAALYPGAPTGSTTNGLALSPDEKTLFIANADNNCLAVFDVSQPGESRSKGFIPTGWYPTSVRVGEQWGDSPKPPVLLVANGKGMSSLANPDGPQPTYKAEDKRGGQYIGTLFKGTLSFIDLPTEEVLAKYSAQVYANSPYKKEKELLAEGEPGNPVPMRVGDPSPIKHVFYIIKENRTYDQVLGDLPKELGGNGDPSLCIFPEKITPNQHALAREFVLLDNFFVEAEVSADGHNWSMGAYATDYVEKTWPTDYGGRGGHYDYEGTRTLARPKKGYIWDYCQRSNVSYRTYGEFADDYKPNIPSLKNHFCPGYSAWDLNIQDVEREKVWEHDFDSLEAIGKVPRFNTIRFGNDHTSGMSKGAYSPEAAVADNDLAVGRFIEHLSKSSVWKESVVFILEDDAQNGPDHVDAHRSIAFVAGPFVKRGFVDHTAYSTSSMLRTMELILGLPPMSQFDAGATPMWRCFTKKPNFEPFKARPNQVSIDTRNAAVNELSKISETFNLAQLDAVPERLFNEVLWKAIKGMDSEMPAPRRAAFVVGENEEEEGADDDD